jgi:hypothetical protein
MTLYHPNPIQVLMQEDGSTALRLVEGFSTLYDARTTLRALIVMKELKGVYRVEVTGPAERDIYAAMPYMIDNGIAEDGSMDKTTWNMIWLLFRVFRTHPGFYTSLPARWIATERGVLHTLPIFGRLAPEHVLAICSVYVTSRELHYQLKAFLYRWLDSYFLVDTGDLFDDVFNALRTVDYDYGRFHATSSPALLRYLKCV